MINHEVLGEIIREYERQLKMKVRLEDRINHIRTESERLCEQTLYENYKVATGANVRETALHLAASAILILEKLS